MSDRANQTYAVPQGQAVAASLYFASSFSVQATANEVTLVLHDTIPIAGPDGLQGDANIRRPIAILKMSPQAAKDLASVMAETVSRYETAFKTNLVTDLSAERTK